MASSLLPPARPDISPADAIELAGDFYDPNDRIWLLGRRGYWRSMGNPKGNDRNLYDDAAALIVDGRVIATWNSNTDPSRSGGTICRLKPGRWSYKLGTHPLAGGYKALVQAKPVTVIRDNGVEETGWFGIHHHRGGEFTSTGSLGCQTYHPDQYDDFIAPIESYMLTLGVRTIPYVLTERP